MNFKVSKSDPAVKALLAATFPRWRGRKIAVEVTDRPVFIDTVGGGGSYDKAVAVKISEGIAAEIPRVSPFSEAYSSQINEGITLPAGVALVVHSMFCGKDVGVRIYVSADTAHLLGGKLLSGKV